MHGVRETTAIRAWVAVTAGAALSVVLVVMAVTIYASTQQIAASSEGRFLLFPVTAQVLIAAGFASEAALVVALVSVPIWLGLTRAGLDSLPWAAGLGFVVTMAYWIGSNLGTMGDPPAAVSIGVLWSLFGAAAGSVAWIAAYKTGHRPVVS